jgi:hypothetical protein
MDSKFMKGLEKGASNAPDHMTTRRFIMAG